MIILKTEKIVAIFAFLFFALFAITECKRGGGGGRIFRATVLKERRNSRRNPRDVHEQQENKPQWTDSVLISNKVFDEIFEIQTPKQENLEDHQSLFSSIEQQSDYRTSELNTPNIWHETTNDKDVGSQIRNSKDNIKESDEIYDYHAHDYFNDEVLKSQHLPNHRPYKYDQQNTEKPNIEHYYKSMEKEGSYETKNYNSKIAYNMLLNYLFKGRKHIKTHLTPSKNTDGYSELNIPKKLSMPKLSIWDIVFGFSRYPYYLYSSKQTAIVPCQRDFSSFCPHNTTPLCTNKGKVLCTVFNQQNIICEEESHLKCIERSIETCLGNLQDILKDSEKKTFSVIKVPYSTNTVIIGKLSLKMKLLTW